jgi:hypothetical protein
MTTISALLDRGIKVVLIASIPEQRYEIPKCLAQKSVDFCSIDRKNAENYRRLATSELHAARQDASKVRFWDPFGALCDKEKCLVERDGVILYHDDNHLTYAGSRWLATSFGGVARWLADSPSTSSIRILNNVDRQD